MKELPTTQEALSAILQKTSESPYYTGQLASGLDLCVLSRQSNHFATSLMERLFGDTKTEISFIAHDAAISSLSEMFMAAYQQNGQAPYLEMGIGFPMFYHRNTDDDLPRLLAPLFIWNTNLRPDYADKWHLEIDRTDVVPNYLLIDYFKEKYQLDLTENFRACLVQPERIGEAIYELCYDLIIQLNLRDERSTTQLSPSPTVIENSQGSIHWSGCLNLFGVQPIKLLDWSRKVQTLDIPQKHTTQWAHTYGVLPTDPLQEQVLRRFQTENIIVDAAPGTGKFHTITNLISNALSNKKKVLVVDRDNHSLQSIYTHLVKNNLASFCLDLFPKTHAGAASSVQEMEKYDKEKYNLHLQKALRNQTVLSDQYHAVIQPIFGEHTWTNVVGLFLNVNGKEPSALLNSHLDINNFDWSYETFTTLSAKVEGGIEPFAGISTTNHPLTQLNRDLFLEYKPEQSLQMVQKAIIQLKGKARNLHQKYINKIHTYSAKITHFYNDGINEYNKKSENLLEFIADLDSQHGEKGTRTGLVQTGKLKLSGIFSSSARNILDRQKRARDQYRNLVERFAETSFFPFQFNAIHTPEKITDIQAEMQRFKTALQDYQQTVPQLIQNNLESLSGTDHVTAIGYENAIQELQQNLEEFIQEVNDSRLLDQPYTLNAHTTRGQQNLLEQIDNQLDTIQLNLRDFTPAYVWQQYWLRLTASEQQVLLALTKVKPNDWVAAFQSWYLHQFLTQKHHEAIPRDDRHYQRYNDAKSALMAQLTPQIHQQWTATNARGPKLDLTLFQSKNQDFSARQFLDKNTTDLAQISDRQPIVLTTPELALEWISTNSNPFEVVIFLGSEQLELATHFPLLETAPRVVAFTDSRHYSRPAFYSILDGLIDQDCFEADFVYHHRPGAKTISELNYRQNATVQNLHFYNKTQLKDAVRLLPLDLKYRTDQDILTLYGESLEKVLDDIKVNADYRLPSIDIVVEDQKLLSFLFYRLYLKRTGHTPMAEKLRQLFPKGIRMYPPKTTVRSATDILIYISASSAEGFSADLFQNHLARSSQSVFLIHQDSLPLPVGLTDDTQRRMMRPDGPPAQLDYFINEIVEGLERYLPDGQVVAHAWVNELYVPILIKPLEDDGAPTAILIEGLADRRGTLAVNWEKKYRELLSFYGVEHLNTYAYNWWKNEEAAAEELAKAIQERAIQYVG